MTFIAERVDCTARLAEIYALRPRAWKDRAPDFPDIASWSDPFDDVGLHWAVLADGAPIAAARLTIHAALDEVPNAEVFQPLLPLDLPGPIAVLTRLVVEKRYAGCGLSTLLDRARLDHARAAGCRWVIGSTFAGQRRLDQILGYGFRVLGEAAPYASGPLQRLGSAEGGAKETAFALSMA